MRSMNSPINIRFRATNDENADNIRSVELSKASRNISPPHREFLRATVSVILNIGMSHVNLHALDVAYSIARPDATPLNINKKAYTA